MNYLKVTFKLDPVMPAREVLYGDLQVLEFETFVDTEEGVEAYIPQGEIELSQLEGLMVQGLAGVKVEITTEIVEQENWNAEWESQFDPIEVNERCTIRAPFHEKSKKDFDVIISPRMSFGTGHHETTFLIGQTLFELDLLGKSVMDMGCGTGVLAIIAKLIGSGNTVGIDIEEWAYENSVENADLNNVEIDFHFGDADILKGSFDLFIANINRNILVNDLSKYVLSMNDNAQLLLSGFFTKDNDVLINHAEKCGLKFVNSKEKNEWSMLHFEKISQ